MGAQSVNHYKATLHSLFAYGGKLGACVANPVPASTRGRWCAVRQPSSRPRSCRRCSRADVNLARFITVGAERAKTAKRRLVPVCAALRAWLTPIAKRAGMVAPTINFRRRFHLAREAAGLLDEWEGNELRPSYASYRLAELQDAARVALECGNSPAVLQQHYRELAEPDDAAAWFAVKPQATGNVVRFAA